MGEQLRKFKLWIRSAHQVVQVVDNGARVLAGTAMQRMAVLQDRTITMDGREKRDGVGVIIGRGGFIEDVGHDSELSSRYTASDFENILDAAGHCVLPGLVDAHTHPVWAGDRVREFSMKLAGASYMDIHNAGGGIYFTVDHTRAATEEELYDSLKERLKLMLRSGTTLAETKTGYGLDWENELKQLNVLSRAQKDGIVDMSITYCGAHAVPKGTDSEAAANTIIQQDLPELKRLRHRGEIIVDNIDVFCEKNVFSMEQTRRILTKGKEVGLSANFHAEELSYLGGAELYKFPVGAVIYHGGHVNSTESDRAKKPNFPFSDGKSPSLESAEYQRGHLLRHENLTQRTVSKSTAMGAELNAKGISHLEFISDEGIRKMAESGSVAVLLPTTAFLMRLVPPPVRKMIDHGVAVALGTDFNPNAHCLSMPVVMHLAAVLFHMSLPETLVAATLNAAASLALSHLHGSIEKGKYGNMIMIKAKTWEHLVYELGNSALISHVIKHGDVQ